MESHATGDGSTLDRLSAPAKAFVERVAARGGLPPGVAARATEAVLETLAIRVAEGQADDLAKRLPQDFRPWIRRGIAIGGPKAEPIDLDAFLDRVAEREGVPREAVTHHVRVVFEVLRETVGEPELLDTLAELPKELRALVT
jgi:uncharacterized protein (DUF2267 family)